MFGLLHNLTNHSLDDTHVAIERSADDSSRQGNPEVWCFAVLDLLAWCVLLQVSIDSPRPTSSREDKVPKQPRITTGSAGEIERLVYVVRSGFLGILTPTQTV